MKLFILPYIQGSQSAKALAFGLPTKRLKLRNSKFRHRPNRLVINWGSTSFHPRVDYSRVLNHPSAVALCTNKIATFRELNHHNIPTLDWTTEQATAHRWIENGNRVYCRTLTRSHSGRGIVVAVTPDQIVDAPLYTKAFDTDKEYRVHVVRGSVIDYSQKKRCNGANANPAIRSHDHGWIFARGDVELPNGATEIAIRTISEFGLDFGAVDLLVSRDGTIVVCEVNTAVGLTGTTLNKYIEAFKNVANSWCA